MEISEHILNILKEHTIGYQKVKSALIVTQKELNVLKDQISAQGGSIDESSKVLREIQLKLEASPIAELAKIIQESDKHLGDTFQGIADQVKVVNEWVKSQKIVSDAKIKATYAMRTAVLIALIGTASKLIYDYYFG